MGSSFNRRSQKWKNQRIRLRKFQNFLTIKGVSNYSAAQVRRTHTYLQKQGLKLASNQIELSLLRNNPLHNGVAETCKELGIAMIAYSPLSMGILTGKYSSSNLPPRKRY